MTRNESLSGIPLRVSSYMANDAKRAVKIGGAIHVSPAMLTLLSSADESQLKWLLENIKVLDLDGKYNFDERWLRTELLDKVRRLSAEDGP